jgi:Na+-driven multidrug efflux pump
VGGIIAGIIGIALTVPVMKLMNTPEELMHDSAMYVMIYFGGLVFIFVYNMGSAILRAIGDSKRPLYYLIIC